MISSYIDIPDMPSHSTRQSRFSLNGILGLYRDGNHTLESVSLYKRGAAE